MTVVVVVPVLTQLEEALLEAGMMSMVVVVETGVDGETPRRRKRRKHESQGIKNRNTFGTTLKDRLLFAVKQEKLLERKRKGRAVKGKRAPAHWSSCATLEGKKPVKKDRRRGSTVFNKHLCTEKRTTMDEQDQFFAKCWSAGGVCTKKTKAATSDQEESTFQRRIVVRPAQRQSSCQPSTNLSEQKPPTLEVTTTKRERRRNQHLILAPKKKRMGKNPEEMTTGAGASKDHSQPSTDSSD
jgi:hypothetical protein